MSDLIKMQSVNKAEVLKTYAGLYDVFGDNEVICIELNKIFDRLRDLPPVQAEVDKAFELGQKMRNQKSFAARIASTLKNLVSIVRAI